MSAITSIDHTQNFNLSIMFRPFILLHILFAFVSRAATDNSSSTTRYFVETMIDALAYTLTTP